MSAEVESAIEDTHADQPVRRRFDFGLSPWVNRLLYSLIAGTAVNLALHTYALGCVVTVVLFALTTLLVMSRRS